MLALLVVLLCPTLGASRRTTVKLTLASGTIRGDQIEKDGTLINRFRGVKFGQDPSKPRWESPRAVEPWNGVRDALEYGVSCPQIKNLISKELKLSEDCLELNAWIPVKPISTEPLPVMLFFYGGSWKNGSAMSPLYNGEPIAGLTDNTIVIAANYRLGPFGFLGSDRLRSASTGNSTGNFGLQDQRLAMQWVHANAVALGADPKRVMIFGESAGAGSVGCHLVIEASWPFFSRAAMQSGPWAGWSAKPLFQAEAQFEALVASLNCSTAPDVVACMRNIDFMTVLDSSVGVPGGTFSDWSPVIDSVELTEHPMVLAAAGKSSPVPLLLGTNRDEGTLLARVSKDADDNTFKQLLDKYFDAVGNPDLAKLVLKEYKVSSFKRHKWGTAAFWACAEVITDYAMACAARRSARFQSAQTPQVYLYQFTHELAAIKVLEAASKKPLGVFHGSELPFVFDTFDNFLGKKEKRLSQTFIDYWTTFAANGDPNPPNRKDVVVWPRYTKAKDQSLELDLVVKVKQGLKHYRCDFWDRYFPLLPSNP